jgi:hypothetical protein
MTFSVGALSCRTPLMSYVGTTGAGLGTTTCTTPRTLCRVAVTSASPGAMTIRSPAADTVTTAVGDDCQVTWLVASKRVPSSAVTNTMSWTDCPTVNDAGTPLIVDREEGRARTENR